MTPSPFFSIVTVTLNAGHDLDVTAKSILEQSFTDFEYVIKDAGSKDDSLARVPKDQRVRIVTQRDRGIFDAMNQAIGLCTGRYIIFMNAGDAFFDAGVLGEVATAARASSPELLYTNYFNQKWNHTVLYPPELGSRQLLRRIPCHQAVFTRRDTFETTGLFDATNFPILADNELILRLLLLNSGRAVHVPIVGCSYKDGGFYTRRGFFKKREVERKLLHRKYFSARERLTWGMMHKLTLPTIRSWMLMRCSNRRVLSAYSRMAHLFNRYVRGITGPTKQPRQT